MLMRDPRFEPAQLEIVGGCIAEVESKMRVRMLPSTTDGESSTIAIDVTRLGGGNQRPLHAEAKRTIGDESIELVLPPLEPGGYSAVLRTS